mmetsp:Transcript_122591/g.392357  ORF Transcript_122591/g.392357 Transcript_122591/m.392357 type:complete len:285 (+) Transcript_122591:1286-2140(+)
MLVEANLLFFLVHRPKLLKRGLRLAPGNRLSLHRLMKPLLLLPAPPRLHLQRALDAILGTVPIRGRALAVLVPRWRVAPQLLASRRLHLQGPLEKFFVLLLVLGEVQRRAGVDQSVPPLVSEAGRKLVPGNHDLRQRVQGGRTRQQRLTHQREAPGPTARAFDHAADAGALWVVGRLRHLGLRRARSEDREALARHLDGCAPFLLDGDLVGVFPFLGLGLLEDHVLRWLVQGVLLRNLRIRSLSDHCCASLRHQLESLLPILGDWVFVVCNQGVLRLLARLPVR